LLIEKAEGRRQEPEDRSQKTEVRIETRSQETEQKPEVRSQETEGKNQEPGDRGQGSAKSLKTLDRDQLGFGITDEPKRSWLKTDPCKLIPGKGRSQKDKSRSQKTEVSSQRGKQIKQNKETQ
jgi:hypothetical protein